MTNEPESAAVDQTAVSTATILEFPKVRAKGHARTSSGRAAAMPKTAGSAAFPTLANASEKIIALPAAILPRAFQLETAEVPTPANFAASASPPTASMTASTVLSMDSDYSRFVNKSRVHTLEIVTYCELRPNTGMGRTPKDVANRLLAFQAAMGLRPVDICDATGIGRTAWSQYTDPDDKRRITVNAVYKLKDAYGLTLEYVYDGDQSRLPQDIVLALRKGRKAA